MSETARTVRGTRNPYKIVDDTREHRKGVTASSLQELTDVSRSKLDLPSDAKLTIVLEQDGTEVDDEEYFATLEKNTNLMVLQGDQKWKATSRGRATSRYRTVDDVDAMECSSKDGGDLPKRDRPSIDQLIVSLYNHPTRISLLGDYDLELLNNMDIDSLVNVVPDRLFLGQLQEASGRFLAKKHEAQESMDLLRLFQTYVKDGKI